MPTSVFCLPLGPSVSDLDFFPLQAELFPVAAGRERHLSVNALETDFVLNLTQKPFKVEVTNSNAKGAWIDVNKSN